MFGSQPLGGLLLGLIGVLVIIALAYWVSQPPRRVDDLSRRERRRLDRLYRLDRERPLDR